MPGRIPRPLKKRLARLALECLESRLTPATLVNPTTVTFQDSGGVLATVKISAPVFNAATINSVFLFDTGNVNQSNAVPQQLQKLDLTPLAGSVSGASLTITAQAGALGTVNFVNVGFINATGINLGSVSVQGDLGKIEAGAGSGSTPGLASLTVQSMGALGTTTQAAGGNLNTAVQGTLTTLTVHTDLVGAFVSVAGSLGNVTVDGSLEGGAGQQSGYLFAQGTIGPVHVGGSIQGGTGSQSGGIFTKSTVGNVTVGGSVAGSGEGTGFIEGDGGIGLVKITGDLEGSPTSSYSGFIKSEYGSIAGVTIGGSFIGQASGFILSNNGGKLGPVQITGSIVGGGGAGSASINGTGGIASLSVGGAITGGGGLDSASVTTAGNFGPVLVSKGISGGAGNGSGSIFAKGGLGNVTIDGGLIGGAGSGSADVQGVGAIGQVLITGDVQGGPNATYSGIIKSEYGNITSVTIGGSLIGTGLNSGWIISNHGGLLGPVHITGGITGGSGPFSGSINGTGGIASLTIGKAVVGSAGQDSGAISSMGPVGNIKIGGDLQGGTGLDSASIFTTGGIGTVTVLGSLLGNGDGSARIEANGNIGTVLITGDVQGGPNASYSGVLKSEYGSITAVTIDGPLIGTGFRSGWIISNHGGLLGPVHITGGITGGSGSDSGSIDGSGGIARLTVGGAIVGGTGQGSGAVISAGLVGNILVNGNLQGGAGVGSGNITTTGGIGSVTIEGSLLGGNESGSLQANGNIGAVLITGDVVGGANDSYSGFIKSEYGNITSVTIGGSLIGTGLFSGLILANHGGGLGPVKITGNVQGGSNSGSSAIGFTGCIQAGNMTSVTIGGSIIAGTRTGSGTLDGSGAIRAQFAIGSITVKGSLTGNATTQVTITAGGQQKPTTTDLAIANLTVDQQVLYANILAGYETHGLPVDGDAQIGNVQVVGNWTASNLAAGVETGSSGQFGTSSNFKIPNALPGILSEIASIVIGGTVEGTPPNVNNKDHFGFVAELIASLKISGKIVALKPGPHNDVIQLGTTGDVTLREV